LPSSRNAVSSWKMP